jgi:PAS domain S-box-containing protein
MITPLAADRHAVILLLEPDPTVARREQLPLERAGYAVATAATAAEGLERLAAGGIDLVVLAEHLDSRLTGLDFFRQIKAAGHDLPAVLITPLDHEHLPVEALRAGVRDLVPRTPNYLDHLELIVSRVIRQLGMERALEESRSLARESEARRRELEHEIAHRKRVEQALRDAEENLRLMVESIKDFAIFTVDPDGHVVSWNSGAEQLFGYSEADIIGQKLGLLFPPEDRAAGVPEQETAAAAAKGRATDERWHIRRDGSRFFASGVLAPIFDEDRKLRGFTKIARDITRRKEAEEAVREAAVRLRAIVDTAADGIITIDEHGSVESMNLAAERIFGFARDEVVGSNISMLMPEPYHSEHGQYLSAYMTTGQKRMIGSVREVMGGRKDGSTFPMELAVSETLLGTRRIFTGIVRDMTEFKKSLAERNRLVAELGAERALLNSLLDKAPVGLGFFDSELHFLRKNPAFAEMTGLAAGDQQGLTLHAALPALASDFCDALRTVLATGQSIINQEIAFETAGKSGAARYWLCSFYPVKTADGTILGVGSVIANIDDRKAMEEALKDADQRKDHFLAMLAHELRNPLAPISNAVQIMRIEGPGGPNLEWSIDVIAEQIKHMTRIVDDLLDVSRITRGTVDLRKEQIELLRVVELAVQASQPLLEDYKHALELALPPHSVLLEVDPGRLAQVLSNLLNNAAKYTPEGGRIKLSAALAGSELLIKVADNGIGIAQELLPKLFDMFVQADQTLSRSRGGLGIGLTVVRSLVEMHDGSVTVRSDGPGKGSEFTIRIPVSQSSLTSAEKTKASPQEPTRPLPRRRILVVDDNLRNAASLTKLLIALGQEVHTAHDGVEALEMARARHPDVILLDIGLPSMDGYEVARFCREDPALRTVILVAMTGYGKADDRRRSRAVGFNAHLVKPVSLEDLQLLLEHTAMNSPP